MIDVSNEQRQTLKRQFETRKNDKIEVSGYAPFGVQVQKIQANSTEVPNPLTPCFYSREWMVRKFITSNLK